MIKPQVVVEYLEMDDPTFEGGTTRKAKARMSNPTTKQFVYSVELYLGIDKAATSGVGAVTIPAKSYSDIEFTIVMPFVEASYPVFLDVIYAGSLLAHYQATENVVITITPQIVVGPITWFDPWVYDTDGNGYISAFESLEAANDWLYGKITEYEKEIVVQLWLQAIKKPGLPVMP